MSYNTRRSGGNANYNNGMGGRGRPGIQHNFVSSGQYQQSQKPGGVAPNIRPPAQQQTRPQGQQVRPPQPQQAAQVRQQQPAQQAQQQSQQFQPLRQPNPPPLVKVTSMPTPLKSALKKEVKTEPVTPVPQPNMQQQVQPPLPQQQQQQSQVKPVVQPTQTPAVAPTLTAAKLDAMETENGEVKKKTLILKGKISKKEKRGRRNRRLRKILVPKNALMVLNELVGGHKFNFLDKDPSQPNFYLEPDTYIAAVTIEGTEHVGYGKSKTAAKTAAAETALRHIILSKISSPLGAAQSTMSVDSEGVGEGMEVDGEKQEEEDVSWLHVASFAMHKLFSSWYAEGDDKLEQAKLLARSGVAEMAAKLQDIKIKPFTGPPKTRKPAKQLPANPQLLNPVMLLNQMRDDITYEEHSKTGTAPHVSFVIKASVEGQDFYGKGGNKKVARKNCAYAACHKLYGISYPIEEFDPNTASEGAPLA